ncbi:uncharacterized protein F4812DRAFT_454370 [Daldinia caldariorum]|uniref:uncharacterized protein n=1 Tax=Daldinia caldariorum TaxID=326644 RepID=UPI002007C0A1|nr:uncharacterized protein F4812DRAFT_454370 [Daldinia caldariorum]KAI1472556.1 hypothetical protein F4812DRAFT_454370 [Daldinia caldariorum]
MAMVPDSEVKPTSSSPQPTTPTGAANSDPKNAPPIKRRAPIACRSVFPTRGDSDQDRQFRHPRQRVDKKTRGNAKVKNEPSALPSPPRNSLADYKPPKPDNEWELLPEVDTVVDGINTFTRNYFQLGFIPKKMFPKLVKESPSSVNVFLLLSILAISARFNKTMIDTYGNGLSAVTEFMRRAQCLAVHELYKQPTLERCQAFYVLSIAEQGSGKSNTSYISAGIAFRMAALMRLHREEAYNPITEQSPLAHRIRAESARRTFWMLHSQDNLHSGPYKPLSLDPSDITALLPSDEAEFDTGKIPKQRAALDGTPPALQDPSLITLKPRSLFASLMQVHNLWGIIARRLLHNRKSRRPNDSSSEYAKLNRKLLDFEQGLPNEHAFDKILLSDYKSLAEDLVNMRISMIRHAQGNPAHRDFAFYKKMARELFFNVRKLYSQIEAHYEPGVEVKRVGSQMAGFIIYGCGLLASYLCKFPQLDIHHAGQSIDSIQAEGRVMYTHIVTILRECQKAWPLAETWCNGLEKWYSDPNPKNLSFKIGTMTDGKEPQPYALTVMHPRTTTSYAQSESARLGRIRSTPPTPYADEREQFREDPEPQRLAPLQQTPPGFAQTVYLPPLSQAPYGTLQQSASPQPLHPQNYAQQIYTGSGLEMLAEASHQMPEPTPTTMDPYQHQPDAYYHEYPPTTILNDGFDSNLQMLVDGAGGHWPPTDPANLVYSAYDIPSYLRQP